MNETSIWLRVIERDEMLKKELSTGIIEDERVPEDARVRLFKLQPESLVAVQAFLDQLQAEWRTQLRSFKRHVEGKQR